MPADLPPASAALKDLSRHGGRIDDAMRLFPDAPRPWLDLSTGINPEPWRPPEPLPFDPGRLPAQSALRDLEAAAAAYFGVSPERVAAVPGSEIALRLLPRLGAPVPNASPLPGYPTHAEVARERLDLSIIEATTGQAGTILLANPNNPDGRQIAPERLLLLAQRQAASGGWLAVDEAFLDATPAMSLLPHLRGDEPVIVFRSFGKFFGLAGIRLGFVAGPSEVIGRLRALLGDWPVSAQAIAIGCAAYRDVAWIETTRDQLASRAARLDRHLARNGLTPFGACPLFRLVETPESSVIFERLARAGILVRPFRDQPNWLRFGVPAKEDDLARLDRALAGG